MKLFVICGHGAGDSGAVGCGYSEAERVRVLGKTIKNLGGDSVILGDVNRNYYADGGINTLNVSKDTQIIELHMDCSDASSARGAHVIIKAGFNPDSYDLGLAKFLTGLFPGRSESIVGRSGLANVNRAAARNLPYRLVEIGFISNQNDVNTFNKNINTIASGILKCFGINSNNVTPPKATEPVKTTPKTNYSEWVVRLQRELTTQGFRDYNGAKLVIDGIAGPRTLQACPLVRRGAQGGITKLIQEKVGTRADGIFGYNTETAVKNYQSARGLSADGIVGKNTWTRLLGL